MHILYIIIFYLNLSIHSVLPVILRHYTSLCSTVVSIWYYRSLAYCSAYSAKSLLVYAFTYYYQQLMLVASSRDSLVISALSSSYSTDSKVIFYIQYCIFLCCIHLQSLCIQLFVHSSHIWGGLSYHSSQSISSIPQPMP